MKQTFLLLLIASGIMFTACDSLWSIGEKTGVSFNINLAQYIKKGDGSSLRESSRSVVPEVESNGDFESAFVLVSVHDTSDDSIIESKTLSFAEAQSTDVSFRDIPLFQKVYAKIEVFYNNSDPDNPVSEALFTARSFDTTLKPGRNVLIAKPTEVVLAENGLMYTLDLNNPLMSTADYDEGRTYKDVLDDIYDLMSVDGELLPGATVLVEEALTVEGNETWNYPGLIIKRAQEMISIVTVSEDANLTLQNIIIDGDSEAGTWANEPAVIVGGNATLIMNNGSEIRNNNHNDNDSSATTYGGGVSVSSNATLTMNGGVISDNNATYGAGVSTGASSTFNINGGKIANNHSGNSGGGIIGSGTITMTSGEISGNTAASGAGVSMEISSILTINGGKISNNRSENNGGGIAGIGTITMNSGEISGNTATNGAGIYLGATNSGSGQLNLINGTILDNTATNNGGGVYLYAETFGFSEATITNGLITGNSADRNGGAIFIETDFSPTTTGKLTMTSGTIIENFVEGQGGGIYIEFLKEDTLTFSGNIIIKNNHTAYGGDQNLFADGVYNYLLLSKIGGQITSPDGSIGLSTKTGGSVSLFAGQAPYTITADDVNKFFSDSPSSHEVNYYPNDTGSIELKLIF